MRLNYDCIRDVLLALEDLIQFNDDLEYQLICIEDIRKQLPGYTKQDIVYSLVMLEEAGYIHAHISYCDDCITDILVSEMTFEGHKYLDTIRTSEIWMETKKTFREKAVEMTIETIVLVAKSIIKSHLIS